MIQPSTAGPLVGRENEVCVTGPEPGTKTICKVPLARNTQVVEIGQEFKNNNCVLPTEVAFVLTDQLRKFDVGMNRMLV